MVKNRIKGGKDSLRGWVILVLCWMLPLAIFAAEISVSADRSPVSLNESFTLIYESEDSVDDDPDFSPLNQYLDILNQSQNSSISIINGKYSSKKSWKLNVMPKQVGEFTLPAIKFGSDQSSSYQLKVKKAAENPQQKADFFTRLRVDNKKVYVQQQLIITQQIFSAKNLSAYGMGELEFTDVDVVTELLGDEKQYKTRIADKAYLVVERSIAIYPQKSGQLTLNPVLSEAQLNSSSNSFFGSFGGRGKVLRARSNALAIEVLPVPAQANMAPWLPAKEFQLIETWPQDTVNFIQGEPLTRTISLKAEGLTAAQLPVMPSVNINGLKQYPDQPMLNDIKNDTGITGYRVEKVAFIPTVAGQMLLPDIKIPWWNTVTNRREVASIPARSIQVTAAPDAAANQVSNKEPEAVVTKSESKSVVPMELEDSGYENSAILWQMLSLIFALGWLVTVLIWFLKSQRSHVENSQDSDNALSLRQAYKKLLKACDQNNASACRSALLQWAQQLYSAQGLSQPGDCLQYLPDEMKVEIRKMDALLYGQQHLTIDFKLLSEQAKKVMQSERNKETNKTELLEPLYR